MSRIPRAVREQLLETMRAAEDTARRFTDFCTERDRDFYTLLDEEQGILRYVSQREKLLVMLTRKLDEAAEIRKAAFSAGADADDALVAELKAYEDSIQAVLAVGVEKDGERIQTLIEHSGKYDRDLAELQLRKELAVL